MRRRRPVELRTRGVRHGPITRLVSPAELGERLKPFVFLDLAELPAGPEGMMRWHPHSGIATVTVILEGCVAYEETTGVSGTLGPGGVEWMAAGSGVWHTGAPTRGQRVKGFQLWLALTPDRESQAPQSCYVAPGDVARSGAARIILGRYGSAESPIPAPPGINYLDVRLEAGQSWTYATPPGHDVAWLAVHAGSLACPDAVDAGELVVFANGGEPIAVTSASGASFVLASAARHRHGLHIGRHSVHTSAEALEHGEAEIERIAERLRARGVLQA